MTKKNQVYRCEKCGNIVEVVHESGGELTCCGQAMTLLIENSVDASKEKHIPVITKDNNSYKVTVGSVPHPMEEKHYIEFIEIIADDKVYRKYLKPGDAPEATFAVITNTISVRAYCNLHGLWKA